MDVPSLLAFCCFRSKYIFHERTISLILNECLHIYNADVARWKFDGLSVILAEYNDEQSYIFIHMNKKDLFTRHKTLKIKASWSEY